MRIVTIAVVAGAVLIALAGRAPAAETPPQPAVALPAVALPADLARVLTDYEAAWRAHDAAALALLFAEDGFVLSGGRPPIRGRAVDGRWLIMSDMDSPNRRPSSPAPAPG